MDVAADRSKKQGYKRILAFFNVVASSQIFPQIKCEGSIFSGKCTKTACLYKKRCGSFEPHLFTTFV